jgi:small subunit ribosomal protein S6
MVLVRLYETVFIAPPEVDDEAVEKLHQRLLGALEQHGGIELKLVNWGKRKLAYPIAGHRKGTYFYFGYMAAPSAVAELERLLRLSPDVVRYLTVKLSELKPLGHFDIEAERQRVEDWTPDREEDDEDAFLRRRRDRR